MDILTRKALPYGADGSIFSGPDYVTGDMIYFGEWSRGIDTRGCYTASIAIHAPGPIQSTEVARLTREARKQIKPLMIDNGDYHGQKIALHYQIDMPRPDAPARPVVVFRFTEAVSA